jgi:hypothetical protein
LQLAAKQLAPVAAALDVALFGNLEVEEFHILAAQEFAQLLFGLLDVTPAHQPVAAFGQEQAAPDHQQHRYHRNQIEEPPGAQFGFAAQHHRGDGGSQHGPQGLKAERPQHKPAPHRRRNALGDHQVGGGVVGPQRQPDHKQGPHQAVGTGAEGGRHQGHSQQHHLADEHRLAAKAIGQAPQGQGTDENACQRGGGDQTLVGAGHRKLFGDQGQGNATHEHDQPFEELAGGGQRPHQPLHAG